MNVRDWALETLKIVIPTGIGSWLAYFFGRRKNNADAATQEAEADSKRQKMYLEMLDALKATREEGEKIYRLYREGEARNIEAEKRHAEAIRLNAELQGKLIEANATLAARDSVIANLKLESASNLRQTEATLRQTAGIRSDVVNLAEAFNQQIVTIGDNFKHQLSAVIERLERIEQGQITAAAKADEH